MPQTTLMHSRTFLASSLLTTSLALGACGSDSSPDAPLGAAGAAGTSGAGGGGGTSSGGSGGDGGQGAAGTGAQAGSSGSGDGGSGGTGGAVAAGAYLIMLQADLEALPTSGVAWDAVKASADEALLVTLDEAAVGSPWLPNYNDSGDGRRLPAKFLAAALVVASSWSGDKQPYQEAVQQALLHIMGSEEESSTDGTADGDRLLATARQLPAWVLAADLIPIDGSLTGTRTNWTTTSFDAWLSTILTKTIGTHGRWQTLTGTQENSAANWGAHCNASRIAVSLYLGDDADVARATTVLRGAFGDSASYPAYPPGQRPDPGGGFQPTSSFDSSWACDYADTVGGWLPINGSTCGPEMDGIVVEDISRSSGAYPTFDDTGIRYTYETMAGLHLAAILLNRQGEGAFGWSDDALKRAMLWLDRQGQVPIPSGSVQQHVPWITNHFYGTSLSTNPAGMGRGFGYTDWLFP